MTTMRKTPDLESMTDAELGAYYDQHADEIRAEHDHAVESGDVVMFAPDPDASMVLSVRIKGDEVRALAQAAHDAGMPMSTYVREVAVAAARREPDRPRVTEQDVVDVVADMSVADLGVLIIKSSRATRGAGSRAATSRQLARTTSSQVIRNTESETAVGRTHKK